MDKYEFNIKVEQIKKLINKSDYETAMKIAATKNPSSGTDGVPFPRPVPEMSLAAVILQVTVLSRTASAQQQPESPSR